MIKLDLPIWAQVGGILVWRSIQTGGSVDGDRGEAMEVKEAKEAVTSPGRRFPDVSECSTGETRRDETVVADLDGTLIRGRSSFPYFFLVAFEAGSYLRALLLLLATPLIYVLYNFVDEASGIQILIFVTFAGLKVSDIEGVARAVLTKFYADDLHPESWRVFSSFGRRVVLTANPRVMVEPFLKDVLGADVVLGSEIEVTAGGRATGFLKRPGVLVGTHKADALRRWCGGGEAPNVGLGDRVTDYPFMALCQVSASCSSNPCTAQCVEKSLVTYSQQPTSMADVDELKPSVLSNGIASWTWLWRHWCSFVSLEVFRSSPRALGFNFRCLVSVDCHSRVAAVCG